MAKCFSIFNSFNRNIFIRIFGTRKTFFYLNKSLSLAETFFSDFSQKKKRVE